MLEEVENNNLLNYFKYNSFFQSELRIAIFERKHRPKITGANYLKNINVGDILEIDYFKKIYALSFKGICICITKKKKKLCFNTSIILRNVLMGVGIELVACLYLNRLFFDLRIHDYKRKNNKFRGSRLYYIRHRLNKESKV